MSKVPNPYHIAHPDACACLHVQSLVDALEAIEEVLKRGHPSDMRQQISHITTQALQAHFKVEGSVFRADHHDILGSLLAKITDVEPKLQHRMTCGQLAELFELDSPSFHSEAWLFRIFPPKDPHQEEQVSDA